MQIAPSKQFSEHQMVVPIMHKKTNSDIPNAQNRPKTKHEENPVTSGHSDSFKQHADRTQKYKRQKSAQTVCPGGLSLSLAYHKQTSLQHQDGGD